jgi:1,4-dihydroxy-2-naphthoyl-CoA hydrolase
MCDQAGSRNGQLLEAKTNLQRMLVEIPLTSAARAAVETASTPSPGCRADVDATGLCPACRMVPGAGELVVRPGPSADPTVRSDPVSVALRQAHRPLTPLPPHNSAHAPAPRRLTMTDQTATSAALPDLSLEAASRFVAAAGLVVEEVSGTRVRGHLDLGPEHHTPWGVVHGGVYTTAVESAASIGATAAVADRGQYAVGLHNATDFLRASTTGRAAVLAEPLHQGRTQQLWLVTIVNQQGKHLARGQLRLQNISRNEAPQ